MKMVTSMPNPDATPSPANGARSSRKSDNGKKRVKQIVFEGERFNCDSL
jgi:hypothetical protein